MRTERHVDGPSVLARLRIWAHEAGFSQIGVADIDLASAEPGLLAWLEAGFHGSMAYMAAHGLKRARPAELVPGTVRVITARMDYLPRDLAQDWREAEQRRLAAPGEAVISVYARGRDYHKVLRTRLQRLADRLAAEIGPFGHRVFVDSAPVLEVELASRSGIGWRGKHTLTLSREAGSTFFLGEIYVDLALPVTAPEAPHCGSCTACLDACPTRAIVAPWRVDARRCISYLTIETDDPVPVELRPALGQRIYGCDDCQTACPWNKYARRASLPDFDWRADLAAPTLLSLWSWGEADFLKRTEGSPIRRIGWRRWRRNLAVAAGNSLRVADDPVLAAALATGRDAAGEIVAEHVDWALAQRSAASAASASGSPAIATSVDSVTRPAT
ncbi:tRNA epoxyqueuosine(34) reductase QueG [Rubrivivax benzoatilyticus]|uniref:Epoxyqueuosine reductase n=1 Tax=Rubrivivax benzoatilyticus TaxID=316997 RepID=A0ABX0HUV1_9BURK|nr:tRNA epoxyqueuosine(34) reductase QueG [Rubrivivax benzoatilyticus]NHK97572.1 tRNA epoxyqueuosine(34) reductase QueG [Rubrivivax benzoatilyticus]NHL22733.1 tRNA epoxyqueuosine(34) reductase QueG [Rubrivivax benzoatilyticus]